MKIEFTALIAEQAMIFGVMFCAGIAIESLWQLKNHVRRRRKSMIPEIIFWPAAGIVLSKYLYYCAYGKLSLYAGIAFFSGLILWKKIWCAIIKEVWVEKDEAENSRTTAESLTSNKQEKKGWKKGVRRKGEKKKK